MIVSNAIFRKNNDETHFREIKREKTLLIRTVLSKFALNAFKSARIFSRKKYTSEIEKTVDNKLFTR